MRTKNSIKNAKYNFIFNFINLFLGFVSRSMFISYIGSTLLGFNTMITSVIGVLNIVELGIGAAINYELYKPLKENDTDKINEVMFIFKKLYSYIGIIIFSGGVLLIPVIKVLVKGAIPISQAMICYMLMLTSTAVGYFLSYKQTLIYADQKGYVIKSISGVIIIIRTLLQIVALILFKNYFLWLMISVITNIATLLIINRKANGIYKEIDFSANRSFKEVTKKNPKLIKNMKNTFFHKFGEVIVYQTDPIVITTFATLNETAMYSNYIMIINGVMSIISSIVMAFTASIGNLIAEENNGKAYKIFNELNIIATVIATVISFSLFMVINIFIKFWVGEEYVFSNLIVVILLINLYIMINRIFIDNFKSGYGIYWDKGAPIAEGIINILLSVVLAYRVGIIGVFIGTLVSNIVIIILWKPYVLFKYGFKLKPTTYYILFIKMTFTSLISWVLSYMTVNFIFSFINIEILFIDFIVKGIISFLIVSIVVLILLIPNKSFKDVIYRFKHL